MPVSDSGLILGTKAFKLEADERKLLEWTLRYVELELEVVDREGLPFDGLWSEEGRWFAAALKFFLWSEGVRSTEAKIAAADQGFGLDAIPGTNSPDKKEAATVFETEGVSSREASKPEPEPEPAYRLSEERRGPEDMLWPDFPSPQPELRSERLPIERLQPGLFRMPRCRRAWTRRSSPAVPPLAHGAGRHEQRRGASGATHSAQTLRRRRALDDRDGSALRRTRQLRLLSRSPEWALRLRRRRRVACFSC